MDSRSCFSLVNSFLLVGTRENVSNCNSLSALFPTTKPLESEKSRGSDTAGLSYLCSPPSSLIFFYLQQIPFLIAQRQVDRWLIRQCLICSRVTHATGTIGGTPAVLIRAANLLVSGNRKWAQKSFRVLAAVPSTKLIRRRSGGFIGRSTILR